MERVEFAWHEGVEVSSEGRERERERESALAHLLRDMIQ